MVDLSVASSIKEPITSVLTSYVGRRLRVFIRLVILYHHGLENDAMVSGDFTVGNTAYALEEGISSSLTWRELYAQISARPDSAGYQALQRLKLRCADHYPLVTDLKQIDQNKANPSVSPALQDLADDFTSDLTAACAAFDDPEIWYPGVDSGIAPVPDTHVSLVIAAIQRELSRELRPSLKTKSGGLAPPRLPMVPLDTLPFSIQRALVERRRLRFAEYGIDADTWRTGVWSLWRVREDPDWSPRLLPQMSRG